MRSKNKPGRGALAGIGILAAAALAAILLNLPAPRKSSPDQTISNSGTPPLSPSSPDSNRLAIQAFQQLEAERLERDRTLWAPEIKALEYGAFVVNLWNSLRDSNRTEAAISHLPFNRLWVPSNSSTTRRNDRWNSEWTDYPAASIAWSPEDWRRKVETWLKAGWRLTQSEWHHTRFQPASAKHPARSTIDFDFHLIQHAGALETRAAWSGSLEVAWSSDDSSRATPVPDEIRVLKLQTQQRTGSPLFQPRFDQNITMSTANKDQRLLVEDLNADGLPEILLPGPAKILWNHGHFDFREESLWPQGHRQDSFACLLCDFDRDGRHDLLVADRTGILFYRGMGRPGFAIPATRLWSAPEPLENPFVLTAGDVDRDGDLDFWLGQYKPPMMAGQMPTPYHDANDGFPSYFLLNEDHSRLVDATHRAGLGDLRRRRTYGASFVDLNGDRRLDLLVVSDFAGADLHLNRGGGRFESTPTHLPGDTKSFGMSLVVSDFNADGNLDFWMAGMHSDAADRLDALELTDPRFPEDLTIRPRLNFGNRLFLAKEKKLVQSEPPGMGALRRTGWTWGASAFDADLDGNVELLVVNGHLSGESVDDYDSEYWRHDVHTGTSEPNRAVDWVLNASMGKWAARGGSYGGHQFNRFLARNDRGVWQDRSWISGLALTEDCRNLVTADLDLDGRIDAVLTTQEVGKGFRQRLKIYAGQGPPGNWIGFRIPPTVARRSPLGAVAKLTEKSGRRQVRSLLVGDSFLSQHPISVHFGLGDGGVEKFEIEFPDGHVESFDQSATGRWQSLPER